MLFEIFTPIWSPINENGKKIVKNQKLKILVDRYFGINSVDS